MKVTSQTLILPHPFPSAHPVFLFSILGHTSGTIESYEADAWCPKNKLLLVWPQYLLRGFAPIPTIPKEILVQIPTPFLSRSFDGRFPFPSMYSSGYLGLNLKPTWIKIYLDSFLKSAKSSEPQDTVFSCCMVSPLCSGLSLPPDAFTSPAGSIS